MLKSNQIAILIEQHYDHSEWESFRTFFPSHGFSVTPVSRLWGQPKLTFYANAEDGVVPGSCVVSTDVSSVQAKDFAAVVIIGGYASDRLRYEEKPIPGGDCQSPAALFLTAAMAEPGTIVATLCHGLWLLTACSTLLKQRRVTCASNVLRDVEHAGAVVVFEEGGLADIVVDNDLITANHPSVLNQFLMTVLERLQQ
ncbi:DJ-1/PfpI family protein [Cyanobium sp. HWJ4-Hawea]|uniref:DJ-1/PfpI family protein n=1 Tax=Cyanobium sp. HWJ4-Hawea TaxID=2823713 RepID=UPI0020CC5D11|nr:DJ-1/PfpI family protein [Cyanobium sp. HWJ4-Hawea]MCP9810132.1 DJ-1/PfpI family protein [Cyanobium sp. HWJ4-Hawea]